jgi:serine/threonine protein kinase
VQHFAPIERKASQLSVEMYTVFYGQHTTSGHAATMGGRRFGTKGLQELNLDIRSEHTDRERKDISTSLSRLPRNASVEQIARREAYKQRLAKLKESDRQVEKEMRELEVQRLRFVNEALRVEEERKCHFKKFGVVHERYVLCKLLGFGGFSQVYLAYDLNEMQFVAVKYHFLRNNMSAEARDQYISRSVRELQLHQTSSNHSHVVGFYGHIPLDENGFMTIQEYCSGGDLDTHLKASGCMLPFLASRISIRLTLPADVRKTDRGSRQGDLRAGDAGA